MVSLNSHSTGTLNSLIHLLNCCIRGVKRAFLNGPCKCTLSGYTGSPQIHIGWPAGDSAFCCSCFKSPDSVNMLTPCCFPSSQRICRWKTKHLHLINAFLNIMMLPVSRKVQWVCSSPHGTQRSTYWVDSAISSNESSAAGGLNPPPLST